MKISGLWKYEPLAALCEAQAEAMDIGLGVMDDLEKEKDNLRNDKIGLIEELANEKEQMIKELNNEEVLVKELKKSKEFAQERYDRLQQVRYELTKQREENAELKGKIKKLEEKASVRYGYNFDRGEWWPTEGTMEDIVSRIPLPLQTMKKA